jgi:hypothetical protein
MNFQKRSKYGSKKAINGSGEKFDSIGEMHRWFHLQQQQDLGLIHHLRRQVPYELLGMGGSKIAALVIDFDYFEGACHIAEDWKGVKTGEFKLKEKLFKDNYPGLTLRLTGDWAKIEDRARAKARKKYRDKKLLLDLVGEKS